MYTIGQISKMFGLPISTLRYYDKEGLFPNAEGPSTYSNRKKLFEDRQKALEEHLRELEKIWQ